MNTLKLKDVILPTYHLNVLCSNIATIFKSYYDKYFQKLHIANTAGATIKYTYNTTIMINTI